MNSTKEANEVILKLSSDEAIVLLEWLSEFNKLEQSSLFQDKAEQRVLFDLEAVLEEVNSEIFKSDYEDILLKAREKLRDVEE